MDTCSGGKAEAQTQTEAQVEADALAQVKAHAGTFTCRHQAQTQG